MENMQLQNLHDQAKQAIRERRFTDAQNVLKQAVTLDKRNVTSWLLYTYALTGNPSKQQEALRYAKQIAPTDPRVIKRESELAGQGATVATNSTSKPTEPSASDTRAKQDSGTRRASLPLLLLGGGIIVVVVIVGILLSRNSGNAISAPIVQPTVSNAVAAANTSTPLSVTVPANDPLISTATALAQQMTATGQSIVQSAQGQTQVAQITQTATLQGALGATVAAQQTVMSAFSNLPGRLIVTGQNQFNIVNPKIQFMPLGVIAPDGKHIAYQKSDGNVFIANPDGSNEQKLGTAVRNSSPIWFSNGQRLVLFTDNGLDIYSINPVSAQPIVLAGVTTSGLVSPDGSHLAYQDDNGIHIVDVNGADHTPRLISTPTAGLTLIQWASDNKSLYLLRDVNAAVLSQDIGGGTPKVLYSFPKDVPSPAGLPTANGSKLLFLSYAPSGLVLYLVSLDTNKINKLVDNVSQIHVASPDGQYMAATDNNSKSYLINLQNGEVHSVLIDGVGLNFIWSPDSHYLLACYLKTGQPSQGGAFLMSIESPDKMTPLFDQPICPQTWVP